MTDPSAAFAEAEAKLTKALSSVPDHAPGHMFLGLVDILTKRAAAGIAECEHALALDRNLASAYGSMGAIKALAGRAEKSEADVRKALQISPEDPWTFVWMTWAGAAANLIARYDHAVEWFRRSVEANRNFPNTRFFWPLL